MADSPRTLAEPARDWIAQRVASGEWPDEGAYLSALVARDREAAERLAALDEGDASEIVDMSIEAVFAQARARHLDVV